MAVESFMGTRAQQAFIATIVIQAIVVLTMIAITFRMVAIHVDFNTNNYKTLPCYMALFLLAELFELLMAFDALRLRNVIQLAGILLFHMALIVFAAIQVHETKAALVQKSASQCVGRGFDFVKCDGPHTLFRKVEPFVIVVPCIIGASWVIMIWFVKSLYAEFGWAIFRVVGANPAMKSMYQFYQIMVCLLKFAFFSFNGITIQLLILVLSSSSAEFGLTIAAIPVVLILLIGCGIAVQREIKWLMITSLILMLAAETYFVYKLVRFFMHGSSQQYDTTRATLTTFTVINVILILTTFGIGLRCYFDFDKGLYRSKTYDTLLWKPKANKGAHPTGEPKDDNTVGEPLEERMSIE